MFWVSWLFGSEEEAQNRFSRWRPWRPSCISEWNEFSLFTTKFESIGLSVQKKRKIDFSNSGRGGHLGFPIGMLLAFFDVQVASILPTKLRVNWYFGSEGAQ